MIFSFEKEETASTAHNINSTRPGFSLKKISLSSMMETEPNATSNPVSKSTKRSKRFSLIQIQTISDIPMIKAATKQARVPHISSIAINTNNGINPGKSFLSNSDLLIFRTIGFKSFFQQIKSE